VSLAKLVGTACNLSSLAGAVCYGHFQSLAREAGQQRLGREKQHHPSAHLKEYVLPGSKGTEQERWEMGGEVGGEQGFEPNPRHSSRVKIPILSKLGAWCDQLPLPQGGTWL